MAANLFGENVKKLLKKSEEVDSDTVAKGENAVVGLYFSAHWCPPCRAFTPQLADWYNNFKKSSPNKDSLEIVFVSSDRDEKSFKEYFDEMPWLALPYSNRTEKATLSKKFKVSGIPTLVMLNAQTGKVITTDGRSIVTDDPEGKDFPWAPKSFVQIMEGKLVTKNGETKFEDVKEEVIGLYFSAHWCGPCRSFTPELVKTFNKIREDGKSFQIIFVSSDRDEDSFKEYYDSMPWMAIPHGDPRKKALSRMFEVSGIPTLVILKDGEVITAVGRGAVSGDPDGKDFPWHPKPVNPLNTQQAGSLNDNPSIVYFMSESEKEDDVKEKLEKIAKPHITSKPDNRVYFFYHMMNNDNEDDLGTSLKDFAKMGANQNLLLIDIPSQKVFSAVADDGDNSPKSVLEKFMKNELDTRPLAQ